MSFGHLATRFAKNRAGALDFGYDLWARHANGDVILHCGGKDAGWFDWFTPVQPGDAPDFKVTIEGRAFRLVRGVDVLPTGFEPVPHPGHGPGRPTRAARESWMRPYRVEALIQDAWRPGESHRELHLAQQDGNRYYRFNDVPYRVVYRNAVVYEWRPA